jgi:hypothetical protein
MSRDGEDVAACRRRPARRLAFVAAHGVALPPGKHRVTVEKPGYFPWDKLVEGHGELIKLDVALTKIPE